MIEVGQQYHEEFMFTQQEVNEFARITGDTNPLHFDETYAAETQFKKPIMHGMIGAGIFSRVFGIKFPGKGTVYLSQQLDFKRPMFVDVLYEAVITVKEINRDKHTALFTTEIVDKYTKKVCTSGEAQVMNKEKI
jgi:acyl dehydratase